MLRALLAMLALALLLAPLPGRAQKGRAERAVTEAPSVPPPKGPAAAVEALPAQTPAWQVAWAVDAARGDTVAYTSHSGALTLQRLGGERLWSAELGGFAYATRICDLDGDGAGEVAVGAVTGELRLYDAKGALRWSRRPGGLPLSLVCGRLVKRGALHLAVGTTEGAVVILDAAGSEVRRLPFGLRWRRPPAVRALDAADANGDGLDELLVANYERVFGVVDPRAGTVLWQRETRDPRPWIYSASFVDLDGDGKPEVAIGGADHVLVADAAGERFERQVGGTRGFSMCLTAPVDLDGDGRRELAVLHGPDLAVFDARGQQVYAASTAQYYFTAIAPSPRGAAEVLLGSIAGADANLYRVRFGKARRDELQALVDPPGPRTRIRRSLLALREQALAAPADPAAGRRRFYFNLDNDASSPQKMRGWLREQRAFRRAYPYDNVVFHHNVQLVTRGPKARPLEQMLALADEMEKQGFLHIVTVGHSLDGQNDLEAVEAWLARTPKSCLGVRVSELSVEQGLLPGFRRSALLQYEVGRFYGPLLDLAAQRGRFAHLLMKRNFWVLAPASERFRDAFFAKGRRDAVVALEEGSYTRAPENSLMARVGLWRSGLVGAWGLRVIDDDLRVDRFFEYQSAGPDHLLRSLAAAAAGGATHFSVKPRYLLRDVRGVGGHAVHPDLVLNEDGLASLDLFLHLLGKGLLDPPAPDTIASLSPVSWRFVEPARQFVHESQRRELPDPTTARAAGLFTGVAAGFAPARPSYVNRELLGVPSYGLAFYPANPYGLPPIVPEWAPRAGQGLRTDGERVLLDGEWRSGADAVERVAAVFRKAAAELPVRAEGAHWMATRRSGGALRITLVDPSYLEPADRSVRLLTRRAIAGLRDVTSGAELSHGAHEATVPLPAGSIRILDLRLEGRDR
jgi:hypothetical protein